MVEEKRYKLGDDLPKSNPWQDDRLGYALFAKKIATVIIRMAAPSGYVIGIHGQWGSGKSTALNFVLEYIKKHNAEHEDEQIIHIDFRPWIVSGHQDLIAAFFKILSETIGPKGTRLTRLRDQVFGFISGTTDNLVDAAATVALTIDPSGGVASGFAGNLAKKSVNGLLGRYLENPSLQAAYEDLKAQLGRSGKRFVVTIDDIDRLEPDEVKSIMRMVKSTGQLPNVVYILAYDRAVVREALEPTSDHDKPRFTEKIVQQEIELPHPTKNALLVILDEEIAFLTGSSEDTLRWDYIVRDGIRRWIRSPRDVVRLSNAVKFSWPALEGEIDSQDLLAVEGLRLFDQGAFNWVRDNRDFLFSEGLFAASDSERKVAIDILKRRVSEDIQSQVLRMLSVLFPQSARWFEGQETSVDEDFGEVKKRRGIGSEAGFDAYFGLHPSLDAIPKAVINEIMAKLGDTGGVETIIRGYFDRRNSRGELMITKLLDELRLQFRGKRPARPNQSLLDALFRVGESVIGIDWDGPMFSLSPRAQIRFVIRNMLEQWGIEQAGKHLIEAFENATSPAFMASIYVDCGRELGVFPSTSSERPTISEEDFKNLGNILVKRIQAAADDGTLGAAPFYFDIVRAWRQIAGAEAPQAWLTAGVTRSAEFLAKAARGLVSYSIGTKARQYTMQDSVETNLYDLGLLIESGRRHLTTNLSQDQRNLLEEIVRGSEQLLKGHSSEETREDEGEL